MGKILMDVQLKFKTHVLSVIANNGFRHTHTHTYAPEGECCDCNCSLCHWFTDQNM